MGEQPLKPDRTPKELYEEVYSEIHEDLYAEGLRESLTIGAAIHAALGAVWTAVTLIVLAAFVNLAKLLFRHGKTNKKPQDNPPQPRIE